MAVMRRLKVYFDGGCRPNPGRIEAAVVALGKTWFFDDLGVGSNGDAEWLALIAAYRIAVRETREPFELIGDSAHVVGCAAGTLACRTGGMRAHRDAFRALSAKRPAARIRWAPRRKNLAGIALDRRHEAIRSPS